MAIASNTTAGQIVLAGDLSPVGDGVAPSLRATGVTAGNYGPFSTITVDTKGRTLNVQANSLPNIPDATKLQTGVVSVGQNINVTAGTISVPVAVGSTTAGLVSIVPAGLATVDEDGAISVPNLTDNATTTTKGIIQVGTGLAAPAGVLALDASTFPVASTSVWGVVKGGTASDNMSLEVSGSSTLALPSASSTIPGIVKPGTFAAVDGSGVLTITQTPATASTTGFIKPDSNFSVAGGNLSLAPAVATESTLGTIILGDYLSASSDGQSIEFHAESLPEPSASSLGIAKFGAGLDVTGEYVSLSVSSFPATTAAHGFISIGSGFDVTAGVLTANVASTSTKGLIKIGNGINVSGNTISVDIPNVGTSGDTAGYIKVDGTTATVNPYSGRLDIVLPTTSQSVNGVFMSPLVTNGVFALPEATDTILGAVKLDSATLTLAGDNTLSLTTASTAGVGVAQIGDNIQYDVNGIISVKLASSTQLGLVITGTGISSNAGLISLTKATTSSLGAVYANGTGGINSTSGVLSSTNAPATASYLGMVKAGSGMALALDGTLTVKAPAGTEVGTVAVPSLNGLSVTSGNLTFSGGSYIETGTLISTTSYMSSATYLAHSVSGSLVLNSSASQNSNVFIVTLTASVTSLSVSVYAAFEQVVGNYDFNEINVAFLQGAAGGFTVAGISMNTASNGWTLCKFNRAAKSGSSSFGNGWQLVSTSHIN